MRGKIRINDFFNLLFMRIFILYKKLIKIILKTVYYLRGKIRINDFFYLLFMENFILSNKNQLLKMYQSKTSKTAKRKIRNEYLRRVMLYAWIHNHTGNCGFADSLKTSWKWIRTKQGQKPLSKVQIPIF